MAIRVLHVAVAFPPAWAFGGIPRAVAALARAQAAAGASVRVWTTDAFSETGRAPVPPRRTWENVEVFTTKNLSPRLAWRHQLYLPAGPPPLDGIDLVHLHGHRHLLNHRAWQAARRLGLPVVFTPHGTAPRIERKQSVKRVWDRLFDGDVPQGADAVIALSRAELRTLMQIGVPFGRVHVIPNALYAEPAPPRGRFRARHGLRGPLVGYLGQISPRKGVEHLIAAARGLSVDGQAVTLVIAGPQRGMALPPGDFCYVGPLDGAERLELLADLDVLAYPSTQEVFGLVPLEGLMCGAPVVVTGDCGCGEVVGEAKAGLITGYGDVAGLRAALLRLLQDRALAQEMVGRGRAWIARNLEPAAVAARHLELYATLLRR